MSIPELFYCNKCKTVIEPRHKVGYESGPFPTAYEDYFICPVCGSDDTQNLIEKEYNEEGT